VRSATGAVAKRASKSSREDFAAAAATPQPPVAAIT